MAVFGKLMGGTLGFALGGPLGAIAGAFFGHVFDKSSVSRIEYQRFGPEAGGASNMAFYVGAFSMLGKIVKIDGVILQSEIDAVEKFMIEDLRLDSFGRNIAQNIFNRAIAASEPFEEFARRFYRDFHSQPQLLTLMVEVLSRVATVDGPLNAAENRLINSARSLFHLDPGGQESAGPRYADSHEKAYAVLKSSSTDSNEQIKASYRKLVSDYHPDKISSKGLPAEFIEFANEKFIEIQRAYETIKRERGIN